MDKFNVGQELWSRSVCDHECIFTARVVKRTDKTVTIYDSRDGTRRCKVYHDDDGGEFIFPYGRYSMAPIFRAGSHYKR